MIKKTNSNIADSFKSSIYDVENSLAILKNELTVTGKEIHFPFYFCLFSC